MKPSSVATGPQDEEDVWSRWEAGESSMMEVGSCWGCRSSSSGWVAAFIPTPVIHRRPRLRHHIGQVPHLLGISGASGSFFTKLWFVIEHLSDAALAPVLAGLLSLAAMLLLRRLAPSVPAALLVVVVGHNLRWTGRWRSCRCQRRR